MGFKELSCWWTHQGAERIMCLERTWKLCASLLTPYFVLYTSSIWLFSSCIFYNKLVIVSKEFSCVLYAILANYWTKKGFGELPIYSWLVRTTGAPGLAIASWIGAVLWDWTLYLMRSDVNFGCIISELT